MMIYYYQKDTMIENPIKLLILPGWNQDVLSRVVLLECEANRITSNSKDRAIFTLYKSLFLQVHSHIAFVLITLPIDKIYLYET